MLMEYKFVRRKHVPSWVAVQSLDSDRLVKFSNKTASNETYIGSWLYRHFQGVIFPLYWHTVHMKYCSKGTLLMCQTREELLPFFEGEELKKPPTKWIMQQLFPSDALIELNFTSWRWQISHIPYLNLFLSLHFKQSQNKKPPRTSTNYLLVTYD